MCIGYSFGELVARRRNELALTQRTISIKLDVTTQHISNVETGRTIPSDHFCFQLAEILKIDPKLLIFSAHREKVPEQAKPFFTDAMACWKRKMKKKARLSLTS